MIEALIKLEVHKDGTFEAKVEGKPEDIASALLLLCGHREDMALILEVCAKYLAKNGEEFLNQIKQIQDEESTESTS